MTTALPADTGTLDQRKTIASAWFESLRNDICAALEQLEDSAPGPQYGGSGRHHGE